MSRFQVGMGLVTGARTLPWCNCGHALKIMPTSLIYRLHCSKSRIPDMNRTGTIRCTALKRFKIDGRFWETIVCSIQSLFRSRNKNKNSQIQCNTSIVYQFAVRCRHPLSKSNFNHRDASADCALSTMASFIHDSKILYEYSESPIKEISCRRYACKVRTLLTPTSTQCLDYLPLYSD